MPITSRVHVHVHVHVQVYCTYHIVWKQKWKHMRIDKSPIYPSDVSRSDIQFDQPIYWLLPILVIVGMKLLAFLHKTFVQAKRNSKS